MTTAFQSNAFQGGAFQIDVSVTASRGGADYHGRHTWEYDEKVERARERLWQAGREARDQLRKSLTELIERKPADAKETAAIAQDTLQDAAAELVGLPPLSEVRVTMSELQELLSRMIRERQLAEEGMREAIALTIRMENQLADDEEAIVAILMAGV
jgi:hypothetical protein